MATTDNTLRDAHDFTPAFALSWACDLIVATLTRESKWRLAPWRRLNPRPLDVVADIGCGTDRASRP